MTWLVCVDKTFNNKVQFINVKQRTQLLSYMKETSTSFILDEEHSRQKESVIFEILGLSTLVNAAPKTEILLSDSSLLFMCSEVSRVIIELQEAPLRKFSDGTLYYKLYSRMQCLILSVDERDTTLFQLRRQEKRAAKEVANFYSPVRDIYTRDIDNKRWGMNVNPEKEDE